jgi:hypothetical protein
MSTASRRPSRRWGFATRPAPEGQPVDGQRSLLERAADRIVNFEYESAMRNGFVTLGQIAQANWRLQELSRRAQDAGGTATDSKEAEACEYYTIELWSCYQQVHGQATNYYFATELPAIVVLTDQDELDFFCPPKELVELTPKFETTLWSCIAQSQEITQVLWGPQSKKILLKQLYWLVVYLVSVLESQVTSESSRASRNGEADHPAVLPTVAAAEAVDALADDGAEPPELGRTSRNRVGVALRYADEHLEGVSRNLDQFARRDAQQSYLAGAFSCASAMFLLLMAGAFGGFELLQTDVVVLLVAFGSGGIGALVSVMLRVMNQPLQIDYHAGKSLMFFAGVFRPVIGALFGLIFFVLLNAGILQAVKLPDERDKFLYFVAAITFLAGFSERRAQDILVRASPLGGDDKPSDQTASPPPR